MSDEQPKKRRFPRIASEHVALVRATGATESEGFAKTRSLGLGGCGFVTDTPLAVGDGVELLLSLAGRAVSAGARVVYVLPAGDRHERSLTCGPTLPLLLLRGGPRDRHARSQVRRAPSRRSPCIRLRTELHGLDPSPGRGTDGHGSQAPARRARQ